MPLIETASGSLYYEEAGAGPPLLVVHGGPGLHHGVYRSLDRLGETRRLVYWDHRGHGRSGPLPSGDISISLFADDTVVALADALGIETFALFGHSFGGWVAQETALRHAERISTLVLAATTPGQLGSTEAATDDQGPPMPDKMARLLARTPDTDGDVVEIYTLLAPYFVRGADTAPLLRQLDESLVSADSFRRVFGALARWSAVDRLPEIKKPTLVLAGRHDFFCSPPQLERIAQRVPTAELVMFEHSGHFMWFEEPERFFRDVVGPWLSKH